MNFSMFSGIGWAVLSAAITLIGLWCYNQTPASLDDDDDENEDKRPPSISVRLYLFNVRFGQLAAIVLIVFLSIRNGWRGYNIFTIVLALVFQIISWFGLWLHGVFSEEEGDDDSSYAREKWRDNHSTSRRGDCEGSTADLDRIFK